MRSYSSPPLVPSSMNSTNSLADDGHLAMTAPGSASVLHAVQPPSDNLPLPQPSGPAIPVSNDHGRVQGNPAPSAGGPWVTFGDDPASPWRQM